MNNCTPTRRNVLSPNASFTLERSICLKKSRQKIRQSYIWGSINLILLAILLYDIIHTCKFQYGLYDYLKQFFALILFLNFVYYFGKIFISSFNKDQIFITAEQKKLLKISDDDPNFKLVSKEAISPVKGSPSSSPNLQFSSTPMNSTALSWRSLTSNDSLNYSMSSPSWTYHKSPPDFNQSTSPSKSVHYRDTSGIDFINDQSDLDTYLKEFDANESIRELNIQTQQSSTLLSSFWSHPVTRTAKDMSSFLRKCAYQLSIQSPSPLLHSNSPKSKAEKKASPICQSVLEPWSQLNVNIVTLTQWNENLRKWISQTILDRLVREFGKVNDSFEKHGLSDIKIGSVGLDRLRKTAQLSHVNHFIPSLVTLIPFLELSSNQEYLEKRIRELSKGGCMSEFKWNGGSTYNGKEWDESLPTDAAIIMHLWASYLDTQLRPIPSIPDAKPFSGIYFIKYKEKIPNLNANSLYIQQVSEKPPHFRVIVGETVFDMVKGYSNLFHTILYFLSYVNKREHGMLGQVYLGRAGVNMLWIIGQ